MNQPRPDDYYDLRHITVLTPLRAILKQPGMYIGSDSIDDLLVFLQGYHMGVRQGDPEYAEEADAFFDWLHSIVRDGLGGQYSGPSNMAAALITFFGSEKAFYQAADEMLEMWAEGDPAVGG